MANKEALRFCLRDPIPEIYEAARMLDAAVTCDTLGKNALAEELIKLADMPAIREWTESLWGSKSPYVQYRPVTGAPSILPEDLRSPERMPSPAVKAELHMRDGYHCRLCGIPLIRLEVRNRIRKAYPDALKWERRNVDQHAAFQAMWLQYDHVVPHARGGDNGVMNMMLTCAPCNFARMEYTLEEVGLLPLEGRQIITSAWDGLERFRYCPS